MSQRSLPSEEPVVGGPGAQASAALAAAPEHQPTAGNDRSTYDVAVVGAGILGLATAREILRRHPSTRLVVLEKESAVGRHQTSHNSGVIHAGIYYKPGSLKARLCVEGARELYSFCDDRGIDTQRCGKVIVATADHEIPLLDELERRAQTNGVEGVRRLNQSELKEIEPHARGVAAIHSPNTGIVDFTAVARALADDVRAAGAELLMGWGVERVVPGSRSLTLHSGERAVSARHLVACAGGWSDRLAVAAGAEPDPRIIPFRGGYLELRPERRDLVRSLIYPVPDPRLPFLGVHLTRHIDGNVLIGPTALLVGARDAYTLRRVRPDDVAATLAWPGTWRMARRFWRTGIDEIRHAVSRRALVRAAQLYVPELEPGDVVSGPAGVRAQAVRRNGELVDDFVVSRTERALHVRNAPSPAATSSLALARLVADEAERDL